VPYSEVSAVHSAELLIGSNETAAAPTVQRTYLLFPPEPLLCHPIVASIKNTFSQESIRMENVTDQRCYSAIYLLQDHVKMNKLDK
jgi:hypothetical protein